MNTNHWIYFMSFFYLCGLFTTGVDGSCTIDPPGSTAITETDPPGTVIFTQNGSPTTEWLYTVISPDKIKTHLMEYFVMESNPSTVTFKVKKSVDLEEIYEKWGRKELFVTVNAVDEFSPEFIHPPFSIKVSEDIKVNTHVFKLSAHAKDKDVNPGQDEIRMFALQPYFLQGFDGRSHFIMSNVQRDLINVYQPLDYESMMYKYYDLNVSVEDQGGKKTFTTITVNIQDADDQDPEFFLPGCSKNCYTSYSVLLSEMFTGPIKDVKPSAIQARDRDKAMNNPIVYMIKGINPSGYDAYFSQDTDTGVVNVTMALNAIDPTISEIVLFLEANANICNQAYSQLPVMHILSETQQNYSVVTTARQLVLYVDCTVCCRQQCKHVGIIPQGCFHKVI